MSMEAKHIVELQQQNLLLKKGITVACAIGSAALVALIATGAAKQPPRAKFAEIDVERINIVTPEGKTEMVLSNRLRLPPPVIDGKQILSDRGQKPGIIFYNQTGDESGGLIFDGKLDKNGKPAAGMHFSMDRFGGDQQLALGQYENGGFMESGLSVFDRGLHKNYAGLYEAFERAPEGDEKAKLLQRWKDAGGEQVKRMFVGKTRGESSAVILADAKGRAKIMMIVTPDGKPMLNFMDDNGKVIHSLPSAAEAK
jgi:hypothetical protein